MPKVISKISIRKPKPLLLPAMALRRVTSKNGKAVYASSDTLFKGAIFGRDSIEVAEDLIDIKPKLVRKIILTLASLQGELDNPKSEEEPGKIIHEYRTNMIDDKLIDDTSRHIMKELTKRWGGTETEMAYYGSVDATPHFIRLLGHYCEIYGMEFLQERVVLRSGHTLSLVVVLENALDWLIAQIDKSASGLIEYQRRNPHGIENQVWKDSGEFYVHENKERANHKAPIASIEVQGLAYDALMAASRLLPDRADEYRNLARVLRDGTIWLLWQPKRNYFALGTDHDKKDELRVIETTTANPAALLDTGFFDDIPEQHKEEYVSGIVRMIMSKDFLTDAGIRSRSLKEAHLIAFWDYHGSYTTWPKETYDIAKGLRRQGFPELARELENRILNVTLRNWDYPEYVYVDQWGRVLAVSPSAHEHGDFTLIDGTNVPERIQAWTVSAILAIVTERIANKLKSTKPMLRASWQVDLEKRVLTHMPRLDRLINPIALRTRYPTYNYKLIEENSKHSSNFLHQSIKKS